MAWLVSLAEASAKRQICQGGGIFCAEEKQCPFKPILFSSLLLLMVCDLLHLRGEGYHSCFYSSNKFLVGCVHVFLKVGG